MFNVRATSFFAWVAVVHIVPGFLLLPIVLRERDW
jgi:hypothetical protein